LRHVRNYPKQENAGSRKNDHDYCKEPQQKSAIQLLNVECDLTRLDQFSFKYVALHSDADQCEEPSYDCSLCSTDIQCPRIHKTLLFVGVAQEQIIRGCFIVNADYL
jgi:hypothetical protein